MRQERQPDVLLLETDFETGEVRRDGLAEPAVKVPVDQQNALAAKVLERDFFSRKVGKSERREISSEGKPIRLSRLLGASSSGPRIALEFVQAEQHPTLLFH